MTNLFGLSGRVAIVTGANAGIGKAIAISLVAAGASIVAVGRSSCNETLEAVAASGREGRFIEADLGTIAPIGSVVSRAEQAFGRIDILINNAGIIRRADALDYGKADWDAVIDTNLKSLFFLCKAVGRLMVAQGAGRIVNIASLLSFQGGIRVPAYTASKAGVAGITKLLANEWAAHGVNVNAIAPGYIGTSNTEALRTDPDRNAAILSRIPAGRWGDASDIGGAAVFLALDAARYVHGHVLAVDGGWLAREKLSHK